MASDHVHVVRSEADLQKLQATGQLVVTDWFATWCGPCVQFKPIFQEMAEEYQPHVLFCKIDVDESKPLAQKYGVTSMPTMKVRTVERRITTHLKLTHITTHSAPILLPANCSCLSAVMKSGPSVERTKVLSDA